MDFNEADFEFLWRLSSAYQAATLSAVDPVCVPAQGNDLERSAFSHVFYDCVDDGMDIMHKRIQIAEQDIRKHFELHKKMLEGFYSIDEAINASNRVRVLYIVKQDLCNRFMDCGRLVDEHRHKLGEESFLNYPCCISGHVFQLKGFREMECKSFNAWQDYRDFTRDVILLRELTFDFAIAKGRIPEYNLSEGKDYSEGLLDSSLRGRFDLNKELLRRAGLELE